MSIGYGARFGITALSLAAVTLVLVLVVLPRRYVLSSGFRESGVNFPATETSFTPPEAVRRPPPRVAAVDTAAGSEVATEPEPLPGAAELLWSAVTPMLEEERWEAALPFFRAYLRSHPDDRDVTRQYAITLARADRPAEAVPLLREVVDREGRGERETRLLLARTLRDLGRRAEAAVVYEELWAEEPAPDLGLEWTRAWAWGERYDEAASVLDRVRGRFPDDPELAIEEARLFYAMDRLDSAADILAPMDESTLAAYEALALRQDVEEARRVPETPAAPEPTLVERALEARFDDELERAAELFGEAVSRDPANREAWQAYADLLQYEMGDLEGARNALLRVAELGGDAPALQLRLARLEAWTGRTAETRDRLTALLDRMDEGDVGPEAGATPRDEPVRRSDALALLGDLARWSGERPRAHRRYQQALASEPGHEGAREGLLALQADVDRIIRSVEAPGPRVDARAYRDSDEFGRSDLAIGWTGVADHWAVTASSGSRWLEGFTLSGPVGDFQGAFGTLEVARWWRLGTIRTAIEIGGENVRSDVENGIYAASILLLEGDGIRSEIRYERSPAYPLTVTLQSAAAGVTQSRVSASTSRPVTPCWDLTAQLHAAVLSADGIEGAPSSPSTLRLFAGGSLERRLGQHLSLGFELRGLGFTRAAPVAADRPLFWDPRLSISARPFGRWEYGLGGGWSARARLAAGFAAVDERRSPGWAVLPQIVAETGLELRSGDLRGGLDLFYQQSRFEGYRAWGLRLTVGAPGALALGGPEERR